MLMVTPCTDWYLVFTGISKGNLALSMALLPVNLVLQLLFLPVYLFVLAGAVFPLNWGLILKSIGFVLLLPFFASLSYTTLARNSPIALAIAVVAFPGEPLVAIALVIGPLIELPVLALISQVLL